MTEDDAQPTDPVTRIAQLADELRAIAGNGLHYSTLSYDIDRYEHTRRIAGELLALVSAQPPPAITRDLAADTGLHTPLVVADGSVFDESGRLPLVQRTDNHRWCLPGGACEVGEGPSAAAEREVREETGLVVRARRLIGVYDSFRFGHRRHSYHLLFECDPVGGALTTTNETIDYRFVTAAEVAELAVDSGHDVKIADSFTAHADPARAALFD